MSFFRLYSYYLGRAHTNNMISETTDNHSFIVKIWYEETNEQPPQSIWRGRVTHVPSHEQKYFQDFKDLISFIQHYAPRWEGNNN